MTNTIMGVINVNKMNYLLSSLFIPKVPLEEKLQVD